MTDSIHRKNKRLINSLFAACLLLSILLSVMFPIVVFAKTKYQNTVTATMKNFLGKEDSIVVKDALNTAYAQKAVLEGLIVVNDIAEVPTSTAEPEQSSSSSQAAPVEIPVADETYTIETDPVTVQEHTHSNNRIITYVAIGGIVLVALSGGAWVYWKKGLKHK